MGTGSEYGERGRKNEKNGSFNFDHVLRHPVSLGIQRLCDRIPGIYNSFKASQILYHHSGRDWGICGAGLGTSRGPLAFGSKKEGIKAAFGTEAEAFGGETTAAAQPAQ